MTAELVDAFLGALVRTLGDLGLEAVGAPEPLRDAPRRPSPDGYAAAIPLLGSVHGAFALRCPAGLAAALAGAYAGMDVSDPDLLRDTTAEVANIVAGNATGDLAERGISLDIGPPRDVDPAAGPWPPADGVARRFRVATAGGELEVALCVAGGPAGQAI